MMSHIYIKTRLLERLAVNLRASVKNSLLASSIILCAASVHADAGDQARWEFDVLLDDKKIGYHDFIVSDADGVQTVRTEAKFDVKLLFVNLFSYRHENEEVWRDNCLTSIRAKTDSNGDEFIVRGEAAGGGFQVESESLEEDLPACIKTFAYWNPEFLSEDQLLNSQTGEYEEVSVAAVGTEMLNIKGQAVPALKYSVKAAAGAISLWYSAEDKRWLALESVVRGGKVLRYEPVNLPDASNLPHVFGG